MATRKRPKKGLIQILIASAVAIVFAVGAVAVGSLLMSSIIQSSEQAQLEAEEAAKAKAQELARLQNELEKLKTPKSKEVQAALDISPGQIISKSMVSYNEIEGKATLGTFSRMSEVVGKIAIAPISTGEALTRRKVKSSDGQIFVDDGWRAITIDVNDIGRLNGALSPGMLVDVLFTLSGNKKGGTRSTTLSASAASNDQIARTLLQNVKVLAVSDSDSKSVSKKSGAVTLLVSPSEAEQLTLANQIGSFHLTLRSFTDKVNAKVHGADLEELITGIDRESLEKTMPAAPNAEAGMVPVNYADGLPQPGEPLVGKPTFSMEIYKGSGSETVTFDN